MGKARAGDGTGSTGGRCMGRTGFQARRKCDLGHWGRVLILLHVVGQGGRLSSGAWEERLRCSAGKYSAAAAGQSSAHWQRALTARAGGGPPEREASGGLRSRRRARPGELTRYRLRVRKAWRAAGPRSHAVAHSLSPPPACRCRLGNLLHLPLPLRQQGVAGWRQHRNHAEHSSSGGQLPAGCAAGGHPALAIERVSPADHCPLHCGRDQALLPAAPPGAG